jgi:hypothetical protein
MKRRCGELVDWLGATTRSPPARSCRPGPGSWCRTSTPSAGRRGQHHDRADRTLRNVVRRSQPDAGWRPGVGGPVLSTAAELLCPRWPSPAAPSAAVWTPTPGATSRPARQMTRPRAALRQAGGFSPGTPASSGGGRRHPLGGPPGRGSHRGAARRRPLSGVRRAAPAGGEYLRGAPPADRPSRSSAPRPPVSPAPPRARELARRARLGARARRGSASRGCAPARRLHRQAGLPRASGRAPRRPRRGATRSTTSPAARALRQRPPRPDAGRGARTAPAHRKSRCLPGTQMRFRWLGPRRQGRPRFPPGRSGCGSRVLAPGCAPPRVVGWQGRSRPTTTAPCISSCACGSRAWTPRCSVADDVTGDVITESDRGSRPRRPGQHDDLPPAGTRSASRASRCRARVTHGSTARSRSAAGRTR